MDTLKLEKLRISKGLSQTQLAKKIGMTQTGYSNSIKREDFKVSTIERIANILEVPVSFLFEENPNSIIPDKADFERLNQSIQNKMKSLQKEEELNKLLKREIETVKFEANSVIEDILTCLYSEIPESELKKILDEIFTFSFIDNFIDIKEEIEHIKEYVILNYEIPKKRKKRYNKKK